MAGSGEKYLSDVMGRSGQNPWLLQTVPAFQAAGRESIWLLCPYHCVSKVLDGMDSLRALVAFAHRSQIIGWNVQAGGTADVKIDWSGTTLPVCE